MNRTISKTAIATVLAAALAGPMLVVPAQAGGSVSISVSPGSRDGDQAIRTGLALYQIYNGIKSGGSIKQDGRKNTAGLAQNGRGNTGIIHQKGTGHTGTITQDGSRNAYGLFQFGRNTSANVMQNGSGSSGATLQFGW